jgi:hypothetical protein
MCAYRTSLNIINPTPIGARPGLPVVHGVQVKDDRRWGKITFFPLDPLLINFSHC